MRTLFLFTLLPLLLLFSHTGHLPEETRPAIHNFPLKQIFNYKTNGHATALIQLSIHSENFHRVRWSTLNHRLFTLVLTLLFGANFRPFSSGRIPPGESATGALWRGAHTQTRNRLIVSRLSSLDPAGSSRSFEHVQLIRRFRQTSNCPQNLPKFERINVLICK